jgi:hypothetical protein
MLVETNCKAIKKSRIVGISDREIKDITSRVLSDLPKDICRCSNTSRTRFLNTRKTISSSRIMLIFIRENTRTLPLTGKATSPIWKTTVSRYVRTGMRIRQMIIANRVRLFFMSCGSLVIRQAAVLVHAILFQNPRVRKKESGNGSKAA